MKTFKDVPMYGLFQTGPGDTLFIKVFSDGDGHNSIDLSDGNCWDGHAKGHWIPDWREVHILDDQEIVAVKNRWK